MRFMAPQALWFLGLVVPLVVLYILKIRRERLRVPSVWLWTTAKRDLMARSPFQKLIVQLPLILQLLALIGLVLAAARPTTSGRAASGDHVAIVVDTSASMATEDGAATRIERAKAVAHELVSSLPPGSDAIILDAGRDARIALPPDRDKRRMHAAIDRLVAREVEGDLAQALALAVNRLKQEGGSRRIYLVTDGNFARPTPLEVAVPLEILRVGEARDNAAIVRVDVRSGDDPVLGKEQVQAFLLIANYGKAARELYVTMKQRGASDTLASRKVLVGAGEKAPVVLTFPPTQGDNGTGLVFEISPRDALPLDDTAYGHVPPGRKLAVVLAETAAPSLWLERALVSDPDAEVTRGKLEDVLGADVPADAFVVIDGACPKAPPGGDLLVVNPPEGACFGASVGKVLDRPLATSWEQGDARMRFLTLDGVFIEKGRALTPESKRQELIRSDHGVLACDVSTSGRYATLLGFDVADSDWPYKASFVLFMRNLLEQARAHRGSGKSGASSAGEPLRVSVPALVREASVLRDGSDPASATTVVVKDSLAIVPDVPRAGLYRVSWKEPQPGSVLVAVSLTSPDESDLSRSPAVPKGGALVHDAKDGVATSHEHAWILGLAALGLFLFELWYFTRRARPRREFATMAKGAE